MEFKDYYAILGVGRNADAQSIRKAFRKLARQYHPDVAKDKKQAEERFKEINEAYEVLSDQEKRRRYDQFGSSWNAQGAHRTGPSPRGRARGGSIHEDFGEADFSFGGTGFSEFFEHLFGGAGRSRSRFGRGFEDAGGGADLESDLMVTLEEAARGAVRPISLRLRTACSRCHGTGLDQSRPCPACQGSGRTDRVESYQVRIPAGVREGQRLRLAGRGGSGIGGGPAGDLYLRVKLARHPDFQVAGGDLIYELELAPWQAVLGTQAEVPTLDRPVAIRIPAGSQNGQRFRVKGRGLPGPREEKGDLHVVLGITMPTKVTDAERALWEELAKRSGHRTGNKGS